MKCPLSLQWLSTFATPRVVGEGDILWPVIEGAERRGFLALDRFDRCAMVSLTDAGREVLGS